MVAGPWFHRLLCSTAMPRTTCIRDRRRSHNSNGCCGSHPHPTGGSSNDGLQETLVAPTREEGTMTTSHGRVRQFTWNYDGQRHRAWGFTVVLNGKRTRRQGYGSRAEAQAALDEIKHPAAAPRASAATITLAEAFERYFDAKARKRSLDEDRRIARHLKAAFGEQTPLSEVTAGRISAFKASLLAVTESRRGGALSAASINRPLALLRHLLHLAVDEWEVLPALPKIRLEKEAQGRLRW